MIRRHAKKGMTQSKGKCYISEVCITNEDGMSDMIRDITKTNISMMRKITSGKCMLDRKRSSKWNLGRKNRHSLWLSNRQTPKRQEIWARHHPKKSTLTKSMTHQTFLAASTSPKWKIWDLVISENQIGDKDDIILGIFKIVQSKRSSSTPFERRSSKVEVLIQGRDAKSNFEQLTKERWHRESSKEWLRTSIFGLETRGFINDYILTRHRQVHIVRRLIERKCNGPRPWKPH